MNDRLRDAIHEALHSKKFLAFLTSSIITVLIYLAAHFKLGLDEQTATDIANRLVALVIAYMASQGLADHGKEAATVTANAADPAPEAPKPPT